MRIFILGFMGTGKTYWGKRWSEVYDFPFIDLDELIENNEQLSVADIFQEKGEDYFRQKEAIFLRSLAAVEHAIISCGGGTPCFFDNMDWINANGISIFFDAAPQHILNNIKKEPGTRPLIQENSEPELLFFIEQKLKERMPFYSRSKMIVNVNDLEITSLERIINTVNW
jgi:shikimate kinase